jgi:hypothetical protein
MQTSYQQLTRIPLNNNFNQFSQQEEKITNFESRLTGREASDKWSLVSGLLCLGWDRVSDPYTFDTNPDPAS